jgi:enoyl-CoA hydratase/carnithine racemase
MSKIDLDVQGEIATLTLNNPDKLNAINRAMWQQLSEQVSRLRVCESFVRRTD